MVDFLRKLGRQCKEDCRRCNFTEYFKISKLGLWRDPLYYENLQYRKFRKKNKGLIFAIDVMFSNIGYLRTYFQNEINIDKMHSFFSSKASPFCDI